MKNLGKALLYCLGDVAIVVISLLVFGIITLVPNLQDNKIIAYFCTKIGFILSIFIIGWLYKENGVSLIKDCRFKKVNLNVIFKTILLSLCIIIMENLSNIIFINIFHLNTSGYDNIQGVYATLSTTWYGLSSMVLFAPIFEEIFFRGIILRQCLRFVNPLVAIIIQALLFGLFHMNSIQSIYTLITALFLGYLAYYTKSIIPGIISHIFMNLLGVMHDPLIKLISKSSYFQIINILAIILSIFLICSFKQKRELA